MRSAGQGFLIDVGLPAVGPVGLGGLGFRRPRFNAGSLELSAPDVLVLQDKALATPGADFTFILRKGELHNWPALWFLPEAVAVRPDIYQRLGIGSGA